MGEKRVVGVDTDTWLFPAAVQAAYQAQVSSAVAAGVTQAMAAEPEFVNAVGSIVTDDLVAPLIGSASDLRAALDSRYKSRLWFDVKDFGAVGDGLANDTAAVQAAINAALAATDPINVEVPKYNGQSPTLFFPLGSYSINTVTVAGTMNFLGVGGGLYAASVLLQRTTGQSMVILAADTDNTSNATVFENMTFKSASGTSDPNAAQVKTAPNIGSNSVYFRRCWFKTPERYGIWLTQGDDIQIVDCTFDVIPFTAIKLGDAPANSRLVSNAVITGNTFFDIGGNAIEVNAVLGLTVGSNKAYNPDGRTLSVFLNITGGQLITSDNNTINNFAYVTQVFKGQVMRFSDVGYNIITCPYYFGGGEILYAITIVGSTMHGKGAWANGAYWAAGTGLQVCTISKNTLLPGAISPRMFDMSDSRTTSNIFNENTSIRFSTNNNFASPAANGA